MINLGIKGADWKALFDSFHDKKASLFWLAEELAFNVPLSKLSQLFRNWDINSEARKFEKRYDFEIDGWKGLMAEKAWWLSWAVGLDAISWQLWRPLSLARPRCLQNSARTKTVPGWSQSTPLNHQILNRLPTLKKESILKEDPVFSKLKNCNYRSEC